MTKYYWHQQQVEPFDEDKVDKLTEKLEAHLESKVEGADDNLNV